MRQDVMILVFWMLSFKPSFSLSSYIFNRRLFSSSSFSAIKVVSSAYLRLLIFLPTSLIPVCASFSLEFCKMYSAYKLNKQGDNIQLWSTPFPIWNKSVVSCPVLIVALCGDVFHHKLITQLCSSNTFFPQIFMLLYQLLKKKNVFEVLETFFKNTTWLCLLLFR